MPLPDLIEIVPLSGAPEVEITVPGSKSITNRALILAALAKGDVTLEGALWSEDTQVMVEALRRLGYPSDGHPAPGAPGAHSRSLRPRSPAERERGAIRKA